MKTKQDQKRALEEPVRLEITRLRTGSIVRPENQLGTIGWHPKAWRAAYVTSNPTSSFLANNPNWTIQDINQQRNR